MKKSALLIIVLLIGITTFAQNEFAVPVLTPEQKQQVLYNHVIAYANSGISYAKYLGKTPASYGSFVGKQFLPYWDPAGGLTALGNGLMYIMAGMHPNNEITIEKQSNKQLAVKFKNLELPFKEGPNLEVSFDEYLEFCEGLIGTLATHMGLEYSQSFDGTWFHYQLKEK